MQAPPPPPTPDTHSSPQSNCSGGRVEELTPRACPYLPSGRTGDAPLPALLPHPPPAAATALALPPPAPCASCQVPLPLGEHATDNSRSAQRSVIHYFYSPFLCRIIFPHCTSSRDHSSSSSSSSSSTTQHGTVPDPATVQMSLTRRKGTVPDPATVQMNRNPYNWKEGRKEGREAVTPPPHLTSPPSGC